MTFKNCASFIKCILKIDGTTIDNGEDLDLVMPMYNFLESSSGYSDTAGSLWSYSKGKANNFSPNIANTVFKSFEYKAKLLGDTVTQPAPNNNYGILKDAKNCCTIKYLNTFWRPLEMSLINYKVELKLKWTKYCPLAPAGVDNVNTNDKRKPKM